MLFLELTGGQGPSGGEGTFVGLAGLNGGSNGGLNGGSNGGATAGKGTAA